MKNPVVILIGMAIVAKFGELLKTKADSLDDEIKVNEAIDLLSQAIYEVTKELDENTSQEIKSKGEA